MLKKGTDWIFSSFEERGKVILTGLLCFTYFLMVFVPENPVVAKILPPWPFALFIAIAGGVLIYQLIVWKVFRMFQPGTYKKPMVWLLFFSEFCVIVFAVTFLTWPLYPFYAWYLEASKRH